MTGRLGRLQKEFELKIPAFVLMSNHFHLLMLTPKEDIDRIMYFFMKDTTKAMQRHTGRINKIYGGRYKGCLIDNHRYLLSAYKYIYQNPLRSNLCKQAENYKFSSLNPQTKEQLTFDIDEIVPLSIQSKNGGLEYRWINESFTPLESKGIKIGLSRTKFCLKKEEV